MLSAPLIAAALLAASLAGPHPQVVFSADFDGSPVPQVGQGEAMVTGGEAAFQAGKRGQAFVADGSCVLAYPAEGNLHKPRGTACLWVRPSWDGDDGKNHGFFADDLPFHDKPQNTLYLWKWMSGPLRLDLRSEADAYSTAPVSDWRAGEWHHIAGTWDSEKGNALFVDGRQVAGRQTTWEPRSGSRFLVGADWQGQSPAEALIDELRVFDLPLTAGQVRRVMEGLAIPAVRAAELRAPKEILPGEEFGVTFSGEAQTEASGAEPVAMLDGAALVRVSPRSPQRVKPGANTWRCRFVLPAWYRTAPGEHRLSVTVDGASVERAEAWETTLAVKEVPRVRAPRKWEMTADGKVLCDGRAYLEPAEGQAFWFDGAVRPYDEQGRALCAELVRSGRIADAVPCRLVDAVDCTGTDHGFREWGRSRVVKLAGGREYRLPGPPESVEETRDVYGRERKVLPGFSYRLACRPLPRAHLLVVESINDIERCLETALDAVGEAETSPLLTGTGIGQRDLANLHVTYTGREYATDNRPFQQVTLFFPKTAAVEVTISSSGKEQEKTETTGAAVARMAVYEVQPELADLAVQTKAPGGQERTVSLFYPWVSPLYEQYGSTRANAATRQASVACLMEYLRFMGFNRLEFHPYNFGRSANFASRLFPQGGEGDVFEDVLPAAERAGVQVVPRVDSLVFYLSGKGAEEYEAMADLYQVTRSGETMDFFGTVPDPLHPVVQELMYDLLREMAEKTRGWGCVPAVGFRANGKFGNLYVGGNRAHPPEESGYSEFDVSEFQKDTGIVVGGTAGDAESRYQWLKENEWDAWIQWRCRRIHDHWRRCLEAVRQADPAKDLMVFTKIPSNDPGEKRDWEKAPVDLLDLHKYHGYDPALYEGEEGIVLSRVVGVDGDRYWPAPWNKLFFFQPELSGFFRSGELSGVELYYIYWELPSHPKGFRVGPGYPVGRAYYEPLTHALRLQNPGHVTFYNWFRGTMGHEQDLREFCRAFRGLPMTEPAPFAGRVLPEEAAADERLWVRQFGDRIAVVNDSSQARRVELSLPRGYAARGLRDLALDVECDVGGSAGERRVVLELRPWDFRTLAPE